MTRAQVIPFESRQVTSFGTHISSQAQDGTLILGTNQPTNQYVPNLHCAAHTSLMLHLFSSSRRDPGLPIIGTNQLTNQPINLVIIFKLYGKI